MVNIGNTIVDIYLRTLCYLPETTVLTAYLLKPKVCQCLPDFGGAVLGTSQCPAEKPRLARSLRKMGRTLTCPWSALFLAFSLYLLVHFGQAILFRGYVPGIVTSLLLLPYSAYGVWSIWITTSAMEFLLLALCGMVFVAANLRFAHWLGMKITFSGK